MPEDTQRIIDLMLQLWNSGSAEAAKQLYSESAERYDPNDPQACRGSQEIARYVAEVRNGFPDFKLQIDETIAQGDRFVIHWTCTGTHRGEYQGIPPTGRTVRISGASLERIENGSITEDRVYFDRLTLLEQLGVSSDALTTQTKAAAG